VFTEPAEEDSCDNRDLDNEEADEQNVGPQFSGFPVDLHEFHSPFK
jgi:hypothetical protein